MLYYCISHFDIPFETQQKFLMCNGINLSAGGAPPTRCRRDGGEASRRTSQSGWWGMPVLLRNDASASSRSRPTAATHVPINSSSTSYPCMASFVNSGSPLDYQ
jgi:hypothetical protein